jgi:hypothetical protein
LERPLLVLPHRCQATAADPHSCVVLNQAQRQSNATATRVMLLALAALAVLFTVTWIQMPVPEARTRRNEAACRRGHNNRLEFGDQQGGIEARA